MDIAAALAEQFHLSRTHAENIIALIDEGCTIPFIARYRKESHGSTDDQTLREVAERLAYLRGLEHRREEVARGITEQGKMTNELRQALEDARTMTEIEDIYRPYRPKRRTRATIAHEKGLAPLAEILLAQDVRSGAPEDLAIPFVNFEKGVENAADALAGACDIIAEQISDDAELRRELRQLFMQKGTVKSEKARDEDSVYRLYYDFTEPAAKIPSHRILAVNRGEKEGFLKVSVTVPEGDALSLLYGRYVRQGSVTTPFVHAACDDAWKRLVFPSSEREIRAGLTDSAAAQAIRMFGVNLKPLLLYPPVKGSAGLGLDPAYRTGCKLAVVDETGKVLETAVIYPTPPQNKVEEAKAAVARLIEKYRVGIISIGNGTASKEAEIFIADLIKTLPRRVQYMVVSEAGASVYSASKLAAEEFPDYDVSLRSAVSIIRRLQDPLAELVKIDPKAIGVGQYQHDMPEAALDETLRGVVEDCVNSVGVDLNTASASLLAYISGLNNTAAKNIVAYREQNGRFSSRTELKKVHKLGPRAFEQCAGFLRIPGAKNILDNTSVHPESYAAAGKLLELAGLTRKDIGTETMNGLRDFIGQYGEANAAAACGVGIPTLRDIIQELQKPGRDIRDELPPPLLRSDILDIRDLTPGMELTGTVRNVIDFGAFVDIGVHQDGLVHISELSDRFVRHPSDAVRVGDVVQVRVLSVDAAKKRISLSMKKNKE